MTLAEIGDTPSFLGLTFHNGWQCGKADGRVNSDEVMSALRKKLVNFRPLTLEFTVMVWQPFVRQMGEIGQTRSILGTRIPQRMAGSESGERVSSAELLPTLSKNLVNFGPLILEFTVMVWQPFMRQMGEICETRSILRTRIRQQMAGTTERICAKFTWKTCLVLRTYEFKCEGQRSGSPGTQNALCSPNTPQC